MSSILAAAAKRLVDSVEFDVNGTHGKGGHGGLTSDKTFRAAAELRVILDREEHTAGPSEPALPIVVDDLNSTIDQTNGEGQ